MGAAQALTEDAFRRLVRNLSADQLRRFPVERLPNTIPIDAVDDSDDPRKQAVLDELAWLVGSREIEQSLGASGALDTPVLRALDSAECASAQGVDQLNRMTDSLVDEGRAGHVGGDWLGESAQKLEQARDLAYGLGERVGTINRALYVLDRPFVGREAFQARIDAARLRAKRVLTTIEAALGRYHILEMEFARGDMHAKQAQCEIEAARIRQLDEQIRAVRDKLDMQSRLTRRLLAPKLARQQREQLLQRLQALLQKRDGCETYISEDDLLRWLDVLVNASLHVPEERWNQKARHARLLLFRLMNVYCLQQETSAQQVAASGSLRTNGREAIDYYLRSEQFILQYFSRKKHEIMQWVAGAAEEKLGQLDRIRDAILSEYRRQSRRR